MAGRPYGVLLCDPFGLDHSATDRFYPHLSLCGANSFFFGVRPLWLSALQIQFEIDDRESVHVTR